MERRGVQEPRECIQDPIYEVPWHALNPARDSRRTYHSIFLAVTVCVRKMSLRIWDKPAGGSSWSLECSKQSGESLTNFVWQHILCHCWPQIVRLERPEIKLPCINPCPKANMEVTVGAMALLSIWNPVQHSENDSIAFFAFWLIWISVGLFSL